MEFIESFMKFSFADDDLFCIEKDSFVVETNGIKACECVVLINQNVALIEAKSSTPHPKNEEAYNAFFEDIRQKFSDSIRLFSEMRNGGKGEEVRLRIPANLLSDTTSPSEYRIFMIVHGHLLDWLGGLQETLRDILRDVVSEWNMKDSNVKAFNEETALENHLIVAYVPKDEIADLKESNGNMDVEKATEWFRQHGQ